MPTDSSQAATAARWICHRCVACAAQGLRLRRAALLPPGISHQRVLECLTSRLPPIELCCQSLRPPGPVSTAAVKLDGGGVWFHSSVCSAHSTHTAAIPAARVSCSPLYSRCCKHQMSAMQPPQRLHAVCLRQSNPRAAYTPYEQSHHSHTPPPLGTYPLRQLRCVRRTYGPTRAQRVGRTSFVPIEVAWCRIPAPPPLPQHAPQRSYRLKAAGVRTALPPVPA
jgi:hypothetical protein